MKAINTTATTGAGKPAPTQTNNLLSAGVIEDNKPLSKIHASGQASRYLLAFFMPNISPAPHAGEIDSITPLTQITGLNRHTYNAPATQRGVTIYGGVTLQNIKALWQICRAVTCVTESEPRHPLPVVTVYCVVTTQKTTQGGHNHA